MNDAQIEAAEKMNKKIKVTKGDIHEYLKKELDINDDHPQLNNMTEALYDISTKKKEF